MDGPGGTAVKSGSSRCAAGIRRDSANSSSREKANYESSSTSTVGLAIYGRSDHKRAVPSRSRSRIPSAAVVALALGLSVSAPAAADEPVPPVDHGPERFPSEGTRWGLFGLGAASTAFWYGGAAGLSYAWPSAPQAHALRLPVAGPWMALAAAGCPAGDPNCSVYIVVLRAVLTGLDGVGQVGGLALMAEAALMPTSGPVGQSPTAKRARHTPRRVAFDVRPMPLVGNDSIGVGLQGHF
jgi:hypothetical protein